jgi:peptide/nickel transport system substrate-binding protein
VESPTPAPTTGAKTTQPTSSAGGGTTTGQQTPSSATAGLGGSPTAASPVSAASPTTATAAQGVPGGTKVFKTAYAEDIVFMDPALITQSTDYVIGEAVFNFIGRYTYDPPLGTDINPELGEKWEIPPDGKVYTFYLRKGVKFHGTYGEVTAKDVQWNWQRIQDPKTTSRYATDFQGGEITTPDDYTVKVAFPKSYPAFIPASLAFRPGLIMSQKAFLEKGDQWKNDPIGSGPFEFEKWSPGVEVDLKKFTGYWGKQPKLDRIVIKTKVDERTSVLAVSAGELDAFYINDTDLALDVSKNPPKNTKFIKAAQGQSPNWLAFNMKRQPFDNVKVRQALRYAIDINSIAKDLFGGLADPIHSFLPPFMFGYTADVMKFDYQPDKAKQMLKDAGVPSNWTVNILSLNTGSVKQISEAVQSYWQDVGVKVKLDEPERGDFETRRKNGDYDVFGISVGRIEPDQIATPYWYSTSPPTANNSFYGGADDLIDKAKAEPDLTKRKQAYADLQRKISEDSPAAFIVATSGHLIVNNRVAGISGSGWQSRFDWFTIDVPAT